MELESEIYCICDIEDELSAVFMASQFLLVIWTAPFELNMDVFACKYLVTKKQHAPLLGYDQHVQHGRYLSTEYRLYLFTLPCEPVKT